MQAMPTTKAKPKKEKPIPKQCVCGKMPATVSVRGGADAYMSKPPCVSWKSPHLLE